MDSQNIFIAHPTTSEQLDALKAFVKALKIKFEIANEKSNIPETYSPDFIAKIKKSKQQFEKGEFTRIEKGDLQEFLGL